LSSAYAADLGGDCCADLDERIAELEATTARKGNRKVSLTISGWVNQAVFAWDDGVESNAYVGTNSLEQDRFRFVGEAKITDGWSAGYTLEIGLWGADSKQFSQTSAGGSNSNLLTDRRASWFVKSKDLGKVTVGKDASATYHLLDNTDFLLTRNVSDAEAAGVYINGFFTRVNGQLQTFTWNAIMGGYNNGTPGQPSLRNVVRYDTPTFAGFTLSAAWGEDDMWDGSLDYKNDIGDFKVTARIGYGESTDPVANAGQCAAGTGNCQWWGASSVIQHVPTGLFVYAAYSGNEIDLTAAQIAAAKDDLSEMWFIQAGIERKWLPLGKTNIFGEYRHDDVGFRGSRSDSSEFNFWAAGFIQNLENADMSLYTQYRHYEGDFTKGVTKTDLDDFDMVISGAKINF
jgi:predicted porin